MSEATIKKLTQQILEQGTTSRWTGEGYGSPEANAREIAKYLVEAGIEDIKDFGKVKVDVTNRTGGRVPATVYPNDPNDPSKGYYTFEHVWNPQQEIVATDKKIPVDPSQIKVSYTGPYEDGSFVASQTVALPVYEERFGNVKTQTPIRQDYSRAFGNIFGGTFTGKDSTGFGVQFGPDGTPYFFTQAGGSTSDMGDIATVLSLASLIPSPIQPFAAAANAAMAIDQGNVAQGLMSLAGIPGVSEAIQAAGLGSTVSGLQNLDQVKNVVQALESGNVAGLLSAGANLAGASGTKIGDTGLSVNDALNAAQIATALESGNPMAVFGATARGFSDYVRNQQAAPQEMSAFTEPDFFDFEANSFPDTTAPDYGMQVDYGFALPNRTDGFKFTQAAASDFGPFAPVDYSLPDQAAPSVLYIPSTDPFANIGDYSLVPQDTTSRVAFEPFAPSDFSLTSGVSTPFEGLQASEMTGDVFKDDGTVDYSLSVPAQTEGLKFITTPSLTEMGGGQGLVANVPGGTVSETGFIPNVVSPVIGDPESFINKEGGTTEPTKEASVNKDKLIENLFKVLAGAGLTSAITRAQPSVAPSLSAPFVPSSSMPMYTEDYFNKVQQEYNALAPRGLLTDVASPLRAWYMPEQSVVDKLFGGKT